MYSLSEIGALVDGKVLGNTNLSFNTILTDSRQLYLPATALFVAIPGERHNGHTYIKDLYDKGVRSFLISEPAAKLNELIDAGFILVNNTLNTLQLLAAYHRKQFSIPVIGITGSNGKTIVKEWLAQCLEKKFNITRSPKSYNSQLGVPLSVWLLNKNSELGIFEAGISKPGEMTNLESVILPTQGIITNIGEAHQQNFSDLKQKVTEKIKLFKNCIEIYYCSDYPEIHDAITSTYGNRKLICWSYGNKESSVNVEILEKKNSRSKVRVQNTTDTFVFNIPFIDNASLENCLHIINYLLHNNFNCIEINNCLEGLNNVAMRLEQIKGLNNCMLINDTYNSDINSLGIALDFLHQQPFEKKTLILSDIQQSGFSDDHLYKKVADLVKQSNISTFIGIGNTISRYEQLFNFTRNYFFMNTSNFLNSDITYSFRNEAILIKAARSYRFETIVSRLSEKNHTTTLEINLNNLTSNLNYYRSLLKPKTGIMVMVKALAYGSGTYEIANLLQHEKVDYLGVAFTDEGVQLRQSGIDIPIMVMSPDREDFARLINNDLEPEIYSFSSLKSFVEAADKLKITQYPIHLKLDTGMHRLGFLESDIEQLIRILQSNNSVYVKGIFSHLAASDSEVHDDFSRGQIECFNKMYNKIAKELNITPSRHILNSAGIERFPDAHYEMVRLGIGLHGLSTKVNLLPVSSLKTHITQIKEIPEGDTIGYNRRGKAMKAKKIAIIPIGYADGLNRKFGNGTGQVIIKGKKLPFIGDICMDMSMIDITGLDYSEGEEVILFGSEHPISELASQIDTIPYEILTSVSSRVKRVYYKD